MGEAKRFDSGKNRLDLVPPSLMEEVGKILTFGTAKYGDSNWKKGMSWSKCIASLKRHLLEFEKGVDKDSESGELHISHILCNAAFLLEYYKIAPQFDDRIHTYLERPKIGLDVDEVICDWVGAWTKEFNMDVPTSWFFDYNILDRFAKLKEEGKLDDFYLNLSPRISPSDIPFEPHCYVTSRPVSSEITSSWLVKHGFPSRPVYTVELGKSKIDVIKESGCDIFVDDRWDNFVELNKAGICTYLFDSPHNQRYECGYKRIYSLKELM